MLKRLSIKGRMFLIIGAISILFITMLSFAIGTWAAQMAIHLVWFFAAALLGHSRLSEDRPPPDRLTEFYLWISIGGVAGGAFAALLAPLIFSTVLEYPIVIALALLMMGPFPRAMSVPPRAVAVVVAALLGLAWLAQTQRYFTLAVLFAVVALVNGAVAFRKAAPMAAPSPAFW